MRYLIRDQFTNATASIKVDGLTNRQIAAIILVLYEDPPPAVVGQACALADEMLAGEVTSDGPSASLGVTVERRE